MRMSTAIITCKPARMVVRHSVIWVASIFRNRPNGVFSPCFLSRSESTSCNNYNEIRALNKFVFMTTLNYVLKQCTQNKWTQGHTFLQGWGIPSNNLSTVFCRHSSFNKRGQNTNCRRADLGISVRAISAIWDGTWMKDGSFSIRTP